MESMKGSRLDPFDLLSEAREAELSLTSFATNQSSAVVGWAHFELRDCPLLRHIARNLRAKAHTIHRSYTALLPCR